MNRQQKYGLVLQIYEAFEQELIASTANQTELEKVKEQYQYAKNSQTNPERTFTSPNVSRFNFILAGILAWITYGSSFNSFCDTNSLKIGYFFGANEEPTKEAAASSQDR